jgi:hypothetical protein
MKILYSILLVFFVVILYSCAGSEGARYDSNSDKYKRRNGIHTNPPQTKSGPQSGSYYKR